MYLKSIEMYGFKSFAERTKIEFNDNITCVVGPNGSGKSNITDAIRWVLGEQSFTALRGSKMSDVIFSGTNSRRALGMAEVIITFDNSSSFLDIDYSEVQVKRKLYKNGDSEYYINNTSCRLKDVRELFMDTGIGRDGYSIISQGKIDEILSSKPIERRVIFEEASGISKFKSQKNEVERKLKRTNENLVRISDLLVEIKSQKENLKKEAILAEKYIELFAKIKTSDISKSYEDIRSFKESDFELEEHVKIKTNEKNVLASNVEELRENFGNIKEELDDLELRINELQGENIENIRKEKDLSNKFDLNKEKIQSREKDIRELKTRFKIKEEELESILDESELTINKLDELNEKLSSRKEKMMESKIKLDNISIQENDWNEKKNNLDSLIAKEEEIQSQNQIKMDTLISLNREREDSKSKIISQFDRLEKNNEEVLSSLKNLNKNLEEIDLEIEKISNDINIELSQKQSITERLHQNKNNRSIILDEMSGKSVRLSTLINMEESYEGYNKSVRDFFRTIKKKNIKFPELHDIVANLLKVESVYEKAITTALGGNTQNLVVDTFSSAQRIIQFLKDENLGRITFLPMDNIKSNRRKPTINQNGFIDYASNVVKFDDKYDSIVEFLLGNIVLVDNLDNAKVISNTNSKSMRIVTLDGDIINPGGSVSGGSINTSGNIFNRKNELQNLKAGIDLLKTKLNKFNLQIEEDQNFINERDKIIISLEEKLNNLQENRSKYNSRKIQFELSSENNLNNIFDYETQVANYETQIKETNEIVGELELILTTISENISKYKLQRTSIDENLKELQESKYNYLDIISKENVELANFESEIGFLSRTKKRLQDDMAKGENDLELFKDNILRHNIEIEELRNENFNIEKTISELLIINGSYEENNKNLNNKRKLILESYNNISEEINDKKGEILNLEKDLYLSTSKLESSKEKILTIIEDIQDNYYFTIEPEILTYNSYKTKISKASIKNMKQELLNLGNVNLGAIHSHKEVEERYNFTTTQHGDLVETEKKLRELLKQIEITMEEKFNKSFSEINENFNRIFKYLFNGGKAELVLETSENFEGAGVDIIAQLPGKKRQLLDAMSGGERSLTTVALLFALLETKPAPFCLLDEVDAALDESNIKRFLSYLKNLTNIQFAIITHRKTTMTAANYIYGITMEEPGISKVISLKFEGRKDKNVQMA